MHMQHASFIKGIVMKTKLLSSAILVIVLLWSGIAPTASDKAEQQSVISSPVKSMAGSGSGSDQPVVRITATQPDTTEPSPNTRVMAGAFTISRTGPTSKPLSVLCLFGGTATRGEDYELEPAPSLAFLYTIPAGKAVLEVLVAPIDDSLVESNEVLIAQLVELPAALIFLNPYDVDPACAQAQVIIHDNDTVAPATIDITTPKTGDKYELGQSIAIEATAIDPRGYINRVEFFDRDRKIGASELVFIVAPEPGTPIHHAFVWTNAPLGEHVLAVRATDSTQAKVVSESVTIDVVPEVTTRVVLDVVATDADASEEANSQGIVDTAAFSIRRVSGPLNVPVPVFFSLSGTASNGVDYTQVAQEILLKSGQSSVAVVIMPLVDQVREGDETVILQLLDPVCIAIYPPPPSCYEIGLHDNASVVIADGTTPLLNSFVHRDLPPAYVPGAITTVKLRIHFPDQGAAYAIEDQPPAGWHVSDVSDNGAFDSRNGLVKFGPFTDKKSRTLSYKVTPPTNAKERVEFRGVSSLDGESCAIGGEQFLAPSGEFHPADASPANKSISVNELTAYAAAWKEGKNWQSGPVPIPSSYVTRAGALWKGGETYIYSPDKGAPPNCWINSSGLHRLMVIGEVKGSASRHLPAESLSGHAFNVGISVECSPMAAAWAVEEEIPPGFEVESISHDGYFDAKARLIRWGPFLASRTAELTYLVRPIAIGTSQIEFQGRISFDGSDQDIWDDKTLIDSSHLPTLHIKALTRLVDGRVRLRIIGPINQQFVLQTSTDLVHWFEHSVHSLDRSEIEIEDANSMASFMHYYRVFPK